MNRLLSLSLATVISVTLFSASGVFAQAAPVPAASAAPAPVGMTRAQAETRATEAFAQLDANRDGKLDAADREAGLRARFDAADTNGNGELSFAEVTAAQAARAETRAERSGGRGDRAGRMGFLGHPGMRGHGGRMMDRADSNNDAAVSQAEFTAAALARFDRADADDNGTISGDEMREGRGDGRGRGGRWSRG